MNSPTINLCLCVFLTTFSASNAVQYDFTNAAAESPGRARFESEIGEKFAIETLSSATKFIWMAFQETAPEDRKNVTRVSLYISDMEGIAGTTFPESQSRAEIFFAAKYIGEYSGDMKEEFAGIVYHEMTHVWQWYGNGQTPTGLTEGIADSIRLREGLVPGHWCKPGDGDRWDQGYDVTARFLEYCKRLRPGFLAELNRKMRTNYSDNYFDELLGKSVDQLWKDYKAKY